MINVIKITDSFAQIEVKGVMITFTEPHTTVEGKYPLATNHIDKCIAHALYIYNDVRVNPISNPPLPQPAPSQPVFDAICDYPFMSVIKLGTFPASYRERGYINMEPDAIRITKPLMVGVV